MKKAAVILFVIVTLCLTGCHTNALEMNNLDFVIGIAFDQPEQEKMKMSVLVLDNNDSGYKTMQAEGDTLAEIDEKCVLRGKQELSYGHNQVILISEAVACEGLYTVAYSLNQSVDKRGSEQMIIVKGEAAPGLPISETTAQYPADALESMVENAAAADFVVQCKFHDFIEQMETTAGTALIPYAEMTEDEEGNTGMKIIGLAVIRQYTLVGILSQDEARGAKWIRQESGTDLITVPLPDGEKIGVKLSKISAELSGTPEEITISLQGGFVIEEQSGTRDFLQHKNLEYAEKAITEQMEDYVQAAIAAAQRMNADFLELDRTFLTQTPELQGNTQAWSDVVSEASFSVQIQTRQQNLGMAIRPVLGG